MSEHDSSPTHRPDAPPPEGPAKVTVAREMSSARRRFLTRGLVGGPVVLYAATRPIDSLASTTQVCTYSAYQSALGGANASATTVTCLAGQPGSYFFSNGNPTGSWPINAYPTNTVFNSIFTSSACTQTFLYIFQNSGSYYNEYHFIIALFNAYLFHSQTPGYPYDASANPGGIIFLFNQAGGNVALVAQFLATNLE